MISSGWRLMTDYGPKWQASRVQDCTLCSGGADSGTSLVIKGAVGAPVGTPAAREALADALLVAAGHVSDSDSETLVILLRLVEATLAAGLHEYTVRGLDMHAVKKPVASAVHRASGKAHSGMW